MTQLSKSKIILLMLVFSMMSLAVRPAYAVIRQRSSCPDMIEFWCRAHVHSSGRIDRTIALSWGSIWRWLKRKRGSATIRTDEDDRQIACLIVPGKLKDKRANEPTTVEVWNPRPLFLWQGNWKRIEVYAYGKSDPLWSHILAPMQRSIIYGAENDLKQNKNGYYWQLIPEVLDPDMGLPRKAFRMMSEQDSQLVSRVLSQLESKYKDSSINPEILTLKRIQILKEKKLGSDILKIIHKDINVNNQLRILVSQHDFCASQRQQKIIL